MFRRIEVKNQYTGTWDGGARGHSDMSDELQRRRRLVITWSRINTPDRTKIRHFFTELGWEYAGQKWLRYAKKNGIEYRVIELDEEATKGIGRVLYRDLYQIALVIDDIKAVQRIKEPKVMYAGGANAQAA